MVATSCKWPVFQRHTGKTERQDGARIELVNV